MSNENDSMPKDKADLLQRIEREWSALMQVIERLDDEQMSVPAPGGWSVKDNLAHLAAWEQFMLLHHIQGRPAHEAMQLDQATMEQLDEDGENAILHERNRNRPAADVVAGLRRSHQQVLDTLQAMTFDDLMRQRFPDDPEARPVMAGVIGNTYDHYQEHRRIIEAFIGESARFRQE